jgi:hypothetical protein
MNQQSKISSESPVPKVYIWGYFIKRKIIPLLPNDPGPKHKGLHENVA